MKNRRILVLILIFILLFSVVSNAMSFVDNTANNTGFHEIPKDFPDTYADIVDKPYIVRAVYNKKTSKYEQYHWFFAVSDSAFFYYKDNSIWFDNGSGGGYINFIAYNALNNSFSLQRNSPISATGIFSEDANYIVELVYYGTDIWTNKNKTELWFDYNPVELPYFLNTAEDLANLGSPTIIIDPGTADIEPGYFDFFVDTGAISQETTTIFSVKLDSSSPYYHTGGFNGYYFEIPITEFQKFLTKGNAVDYTLLYKLEGASTSQTTVVNTVYGGFLENPTDSILKENFGILNNTMQNVINAVNSSHQESEETQKGILNTIKQVVSFINPLSENFFVYKLIDLLIDALKSLFIPGDSFFSDYFSELMNWFSDRLGFLAYPLELILNILNKILSINFSEPIVHIPDIVEPSTNIKIISSTEFNFNSLLANDILKNVHDIYLVLVDAVVIFGLVNLLKHKMEEVETK